MNTLSNYICKNPFNYLDVQSDSSFICCPSWCSVNINNKHDLELGWNSERANDIRKSILDGSYKYCDKKVCPSLNEILNKNKIPHNFIEKDRFLKYYSINSIEDIKNIKFSPEYILFGFDRSCNLKCPSCRLNFIPNDKENTLAYKNKLEILSLIENNFSNNAREIYITGSGDPFYSNIYRNYLQNFDDKKWPNLKNIKIITNGMMLNQKMWNSLNSKKFIKSIEISIDAGKKETYESVTRLNGNWDILIENLKFISTLESVDELFLSFVVSELNYKEMDIFYNTMMDIFKNSEFTKRKNKLQIVYRQHVYWNSGKYSEKEVEDIQVFNFNHSKFEEFKKEFNQICNKKFVTHNFNHLIEKSVI